MGDKVELVDKIDKDRPSSWLVQGILMIEKVYYQPLEEVYRNKKLSGAFRDFKEMMQTFQRFYGKIIDATTNIMIIEFKFARYNQPLKYLDDIDKEIDKSLKDAVLYADGGSRGNPGPSALGFVVKDKNNSIIHSDNKYLGITTNNQAEYHAVIEGLEWSIKHRIENLDVRLDSMLVVNQLKGIYRVKNRDLWSLYETTKRLVTKFNSITFTHIPRELNKLADKEVNKALNAIKGEDIVQ